MSTWASLLQILFALSIHLSAIVSIDDASRPVADPSVISSLTSSSSQYPSYVPSIAPLILTIPPSYQPTYSSVIIYFFEQEIEGILLSEFLSNRQCQTVFSQTVAHFISGTDATDINITKFNDLSFTSDKKMSLVYSVPFSFVGNHDKFLEVGREVKNDFVDIVVSGNFTKVLRQKSDSSNLAILRNVTATTLTVVDFDHSYGSQSPSMSPTQGSHIATTWMSEPWLRLATYILLCCIITGMLFTLGLYWSTCSIYIRKKCIEPSPDDNYEESSSDSEPDWDNDEVTVFKPHPDIAYVDDMY